MKRLAEDHPCETDDEMLKYLAEAMPYVFSKGSKCMRSMLDSGPRISYLFEHILYLFCRFA